MRITMVKKQLANGEPCEKCAQAQEMLERRGLWSQIDEVVWAIEGLDDSPGVVLGREHAVKVAPFFIVRRDDGNETAVTSALRLMRDFLPGAMKEVEGEPAASVDVERMNRELSGADPGEVLRWGLSCFGSRCAIAFSGGEDVVLIDMATRLGVDFRVFTLDTGRLRAETYDFLDEVRRRYGVAIDIHLPDAGELAALVRAKGQSSFYRDGHRECCEVRKQRPLARVLGGLDAWISGHRPDRLPAASPALPVVQHDPIFEGARGSLVKLNPLAGWTAEQVWEYMREHHVPRNTLHDQGFRVIDCGPCIRATDSEAGAREGRWWWEEAEARRSLLHEGTR